MWTFSIASTTGEPAGEPAGEPEFVDQELDNAKDEHFEIITEVKPIQHLQPEAEDEEESKRARGRPPKIPLTEEETTVFVQGILVMPNLFFPKLPARTAEQIKPFAHELYVYCIKKGIDIRDYFFDEFGLLVTGAVLARGYWDDYKMFYGKEIKEKEKQQTTIDKKLDADYEHRKEVDAAALAANTKDEVKV